MTDGTAITTGPNVNRRCGEFPAGTMRLGIERSTGILSARDISTMSSEEFLTKGYKEDHRASRRLQKSYRDMAKQRSPCRPCFYQINFQYSLFQDTTQERCMTRATPTKYLRHDNGLVISCAGGMPVTCTTSPTGGNSSGNTTLPS